MKLFICTSKHLYDKINPIKDNLEQNGHEVTLPNSFDDPMKEEEMKESSPEDHIEWKSKMLRLQKEKVKENDAILVLNLDKNGQENYIGGATFLEIYMAFETNKKIFLYNDIPDNNFKDELIAMNPTVINGNLDLIN